ncbi:MAG: pyrroloquinoline-quinone synthase PqqC [Terriglobales bacterium]
MASGTVTEQNRSEQSKSEQSAKLTFDELRAGMRRIGEERYHHRHPFHLLMHEGKLSRGQLQAWALNRYYYQSIIPIKDAIILSRSTDSSFRRAWRKRIIDHDGDQQRTGGILRWIKLAEATGLDRERVERAEGILPATRFIGNEYLNLVRTRPFTECVASSLTELFSRDLITLRMEKLRQHYPWLASGLDYFEARLTEAPEDAAFAIQYVFDHAPTRAEQENAIKALRDKCDILWAQLDALYFAYVEPGWPPPGAFQITGDVNNGDVNKNDRQKATRG